MDDDRPELVMGNQTTARINRAISVPAVLTAPDGRVFEIRKWTPAVSVGSAVTVTLDVFIRMRDA